MKKELMEKIEKRDLMVGVIGLGYVGLPLAVEKAAAGFTTIGFDVQVEKVSMVMAGKNYIGDVIEEKLSDLVQAGKLSATTDYSFIKEVDFVAICVPTPLDDHQQPDISYVEASARAVGKNMKKGSIIVLESTTYPGTTEELLLPILEKESGFKCGRDFYLGFSPERVDPGNKLYKTKNTPKVVGGVGKDATEVIAAVYRAVLDSDVHIVSSPAIAEMEKLLENTYRNVNIGLINELAILCDRMNINIWEVIEAASSKPYGFTPFYPGPGLGGHCIPLDPYYLSWKARECNFHTSMIESSMMINDRMPEYCVERISKILNQSTKSLRGSKILVLGVAYKQDIDDYRESPAISVIEQMEKSGAKVDFYDPFVPKYKHKSNEKVGLEFLTPQVVGKYDLVVVTTCHTTFDYEMIQKNAMMIFDTKNAFKNVLNKCNIEVL